MSTPAAPTLAEVVDLLHGWYPPATADSWDAVGLAAGDPADDVRRVMFAVDPTLEVAREAVEWGADLLVTHHPLFLSGVHGVAATTPKGRTLHTLTAGGCALLTAHTNADQASGGVSESLALALGLTDLAPILPAPAAPRRQGRRPRPGRARRPGAHGADRRRRRARSATTTRAPSPARARAASGRSRAPRPPSARWDGSRSCPRCASRPCVPRARRTAVVRALLAAHPYEEPAFDLVETADPGLPPPAPAGSAPWPPPPCAASPSTSRPCCPPPPTASGWPVTPTGPYDAWRCAGEQATSCSTGWPGRTSTST